MKIETKITEAVKVIVEELYGQPVPENMVQLQQTRPEFEGQITLVVFPFTKLSHKAPDATAQEIGERLVERVPEVISNVECKGCNGKGLVPMSASDMARRQKEIDDYAKAAGALMDTHNLTPQEVIAFNDLLKEAMKMVPVYVNCTACGGTGKCKQCGGYMNVSLDGPLCRICGGSGFCPACGGNRQIMMGYQENPYKDQYIKRAKEILEQGKKRKR